MPDSDSHPRHAFQSGDVNHFLAFVPEQRALIDQARAGCLEAREKLCSLVYVIARHGVAIGTPAEEIRARLLGQSNEVAGEGGIDQIARVADVAEAIEDALAARPPRYPQWIDLNKLGSIPRWSPPRV